VSSLPEEVERLRTEAGDWYLAPWDAWHVVDRWWTDHPIHRCYLTVRAPNGKLACIGWDGDTETWSLREDGSP
jgi:hypothetical protein